MTTTAIIITGLRKAFDDQVVLDDLALCVPRGTIFALLGSNGAGKTTLIRILATLLRADGGTASIDGFDVAREPGAVRSAISLTGQFAAVDDVLTGRENLVLMGRLRHLRDPSAAADALVTSFDLGEAASRRVQTYSGGQRRRLDIAMSLVGDPSVLFLDEPTTGLDPQARRELWRTVRELAGRGTTVLLTTQYLEEAEQLADRIAILHRGRVIAEGSPSELKRLLPPGPAEYVEKRAALEDVFLSLVGEAGDRGQGSA